MSLLKTWTKDRKSVERTAAFAGMLRPTIVAITGSVETLVRPGWLYANGAAVSRAKYAALFARVGTTWGAGNGSTTFNIPDYRGRSLSCALDGQSAGGTRMAATAGTAAGEETHALVAAEIPRHVHNAGSLSIPSGGNQAHTQSFTMGANNNSGGNPQDRVRSGWQSGAVGGSTGFFSGSTSNVSHAHPAGEWGGATGNGSGDGLAGSGHSNVAPVVGCAVMVSY